MEENNNNNMKQMNQIGFLNEINQLIHNDMLIEQDNNNAEINNFLELDEFREKHDQRDRKNQIETKEDISSSIYCTINLYIQTNWIMLICPKCKEYLPAIKLIKNENIFQLEINCANCSQINSILLKDYLLLIKQKENLSANPCLLNEYHGLASVCYCVKCKVFCCIECIREHKLYNLDHYFSLRKIKNYNFCTDHGKKKNIYFCKKCNKGICRKCIKLDHKKHLRIHLNKDDNIKERYEMIQEYLSEEKKRNQNKKENILKKFSQGNYNAEIVNITNAIDLNDINIDNVSELLSLAYTNFGLMKNIEAFDLLNDILMRCEDNKKRIDNVDQNLNEEGNIDDNQKMKEFILYLKNNDFIGDEEKWSIYNALSKFNKGIIGVVNYCFDSVNNFMQRNNITN